MQHRSAIDGLSCGLVGATDLERSKDFYCGTLGFEDLGTRVVDPVKGVRRCRLESGGRFLELETVPEPDETAWVRDDLQLGVRHIGMKVDDVDSWAERVRATGAHFTMEPKDAFGDVRITFFEDPDGTLLEFVQGNVNYNKRWSDDLADAEAAVPVPSHPRFDHVAISVADLDAAVDFYQQHLGFGVIGQLLRDDDPRGFVITYFQAGAAVLEVFSFAQPMKPNSWRSEAATPGLLHVSLATGDIEAAEKELTAAGAARRKVPYGPSYPPVYADPDGTPLELVEAVA